MPLAGQGQAIGGASAVSPVTPDQRTGPKHKLVVFISKLCYKCRLTYQQIEAVFTPSQTSNLSISITRSRALQPVYCKLPSI
jgi:hypothetical protein